MVFYLSHIQYTIMKYLNFHFDTNMAIGYTYIELLLLQ